MSQIATASFLDTLANIASCIAVIIAASELAITAREQREAIARQRREATLQRYESFVHEELVGAVKDLEMALMPERYSERVLDPEEIETNETLKDPCIRFLLAIEPFAAGVNVGIYDIEMLDRLYGENLIRFWRTTKGYPEYRARCYGLRDLYKEYLDMMPRLEKVHLTRSEDVE